MGPRVVPRMRGEFPFPVSCRRSGPRAPVVSGLGARQGGDELAQEGGEVAWDAGGDEVPVPHHRLVHPGGAGVLQVVPDGEEACDDGRAG